MRAKIIYDDVVAGVADGPSNVIDIGLEAAAIDRIIQHHGRHDTG
nr:hypothetical protein [Acetobacter tropicalis]